MKHRPVDTEEDRWRRADLLPDWDNWELVGFDSFRDAAGRWAIQRERELRRAAMLRAAMTGDPLATFGRQ